MRLSLLGAAAGGARKRPGQYRALPVLSAAGGPVRRSRSRSRGRDRDYPVLRAGNLTITISDEVCKRCSQPPLVFTMYCGSLFPSMRTAQWFRYIGDDRQSRDGRRGQFEPSPLAPRKVINAWSDYVAPGLWEAALGRAIQPTLAWPARRMGNSERDVATAIPSAAPVADCGNDSSTWPALFFPYRNARSKRPISRDSWRIFLACSVPKGVLSGVSPRDRVATFLHIPRAIHKR